MARRLPTWLTESERKRVLSTELAPRNELRNLAILTAFIFSGLRCNELRMLDVGDIDFVEGSIHVRFAKRKKERVVPLHAAAEVALSDYLAGRDSGPVFLSERGQRISLRRLRSLIKEIGERAGLKKDIHPHTLRHSFAVALLDKDVNLEYIRRLLGHEKLETTTIYLHCSTEKLRSAVDLI